MRFDNIDFALDSKTTVDTLNNTRPNISEFGLIIFAYRSLFNLKYSPTQMSYLFRDKQIR